MCASPSACACFAQRNNTTTRPSPPSIALSFHSSNLVTEPVFALVEDVVAAVAEVDDEVRKSVLSVVLVDEVEPEDSLVEGAGLLLVGSRLDAVFDLVRDSAMIETIALRSGPLLVDVGATVEVGLEEGFALLLDDSTAGSAGTDVLPAPGPGSNPLSTISREYGGSKLAPVASGKHVIHSGREFITFVGMASSGSHLFVPNGGVKRASCGSVIYVVEACADAGKAYPVETRVQPARSAQFICFVEVSQKTVHDPMRPPPSIVDDILRILLVQV